LTFLPGLALRLNANPGLDVHSPDHDPKVTGDELDCHVQEVQAKDKLQRCRLDALDNRRANLGSNDSTQG
jgi:hypothetical protein